MRIQWAEGGMSSHLLIQPKSLRLVNLSIPWHILIPYACVVCMLGKYLPLARG
jgi:hypothetical protein